MDVVCGREENTRAARILDLDLIHLIRILQIHAQTGDTVLHVDDIFLAAQALDDDGCDGGPVLFLEQHAGGFLNLKGFPSRRLQIEFYYKPLKYEIENYKIDDSQDHKADPLGVLIQQSENAEVENRSADLSDTDV